MVATNTHGYWRLFRAAGRRSRERRAIAGVSNGPRFQGIEALEARMLLSREAMPAFEFPGLSALPASALVSMGIEAPSRAASASWAPEALEGPTWSRDRQTDEPPAAIILQDEWGGMRSSLDETGAGGLLDEGAEIAADVPNPMSAPAGENSAGGFVSGGFIYEGLDDLPEIPWTADHTVEGSFDPSRGQVAYKVPIGPETGSLRLWLRPTQGGASAAPIIDRLFLVDPSGRVIAKITTAPFNGGAGAGGHKLLVLLPGAPEGSELVIHLSLGSDQSTTSPGSGSGSSGGGFDGEPPPPFIEPTGFVFNVQRSDPNPASTLEDPSPAPPMEPIGMAPPSSTDRVGGWTPLQAASLIVDGLIRIERGRSANDGLPTSSRFGTDPESRSAGASSVYLGPLVSRGAAPLGPTLATSTDGPTQLIDREAQAVDEAIERIEAELDSGLLEGLKRRDVSASAWSVEAGVRPSARAEAPDEPTIAITGPRGLPVLISRAGRRLPRAEALALAKHLQSRSVEEALTAEVPGPPTMADQAEVAGDVEVARAGLATRAAGLIAGLGLATGPLYPDLIALARKKFTRAKRPAIKRRWPF